MDITEFTPEKVGKPEKMETELPLPPLPPSHDHGSGRHGGHHHHHHNDHK